jgi:phosphohistidine phosphatase
VKLWLWRHGPAVDVEAFAGGDGERPLTPAGVRVTRAAARGLARCFAAAAPRIVSSPRLRARQTADLAVRALGARRVEVCGALDADRSAADVLSWLRRQPRRDTLLVGHMPNLGELASLLAWGRGGAPLRLRKAGACLLTVEGPPRAGRARLEWLVDAAWLRSAGPGKRGTT